MVGLLRHQLHVHVHNCIYVEATTFIHQIIGSHKGNKSCISDSTKAIYPLHHLDMPKGHNIIFCLILMLFNTLLTYYRIM